MQLYFPQASSDLEGVSHKSEKQFSDMGVSPLTSVAVARFAIEVLLGKLSSKIRALLEGPNAGNSKNHQSKTAPSEQ